MGFWGLGVLGFWNNSSYLPQVQIRGWLRDDGTNSTTGDQVIHLEANANWYRNSIENIFFSIAWYVRIKPTPAKGSYINSYPIAGINRPVNGDIGFRFTDINGNLLEDKNVPASYSLVVDVEKSDRY